MLIVGIARKERKPVSGRAEGSSLTYKVFERLYFKSFVCYCDVFKLIFSVFLYYSVYKVIETGWILVRLLFSAVRTGSDKSYKKVMTGTKKIKPKKLSSDSSLSVQSLDCCLY